MTNPQEVWQIDVNGQIYEANFEELAQWIAEGSLLPQDKVRRGNLRWLEAGKIPSLFGFFNAKELGIMPPPVLTTTNAGAQMKAETTVQTENVATAPVTFAAESPFEKNFSETVTETVTRSNEPLSQHPTQPQESFTTNFQNFSEVPPPPPPNACSVHPAEEPKYICEGCGNLFCKSCPKSYGGSVRVCPACGAFCKAIVEFQAKQQKAVQYHSDLARGFGFEDFGNAMAYPFRFRFSLFSGALLFMFFTLGQGGGGLMGGMFMAASSILCFMMANALTFGCLANTVDNMAQGKLGDNFMPSFDDFSLWDDVVHPFFLSIAAYIASFGLLLVLVLGMVWYAWKTITVPGQNAAASQISQQVKEARQSGFTPNGERMITERDLTPEQRKAFENQDFVEFQRLLNEQRQSQLKSAVAGKTPADEIKETQAGILNLLKIGVPFLILAFLALLWGLFYFPAACAVAGYTRSFAATINPLVGLDTIKRIGFDYVKILAMCLLLALMSGSISWLIGMALSPFDLPGLGNLPAKAIGSLFNFYFSVVFSVVLGYALYKNSAKLSLYR